MKSTKALQIVLIALLIVPAFADDADDRESLELARQEAFRSGFGMIVESLNLGSFDLLVSSINREEFVDRIFGLRLIAQKVQRDFREKMQTQFADLIKGGFIVSEDGVKATLLGVESRGDRGRRSGERRDAGFGQGRCARSWHRGVRRSRLSRGLQPF